MVAIRKHRAGKPITCGCGATINDGKHVCPVTHGIACEGTRVQTIDWDAHCWPTPVRERIRVRLDDKPKRVRL